MYAFLRSALAASVLLAPVAMVSQPPTMIPHKLGTVKTMKGNDLTISLAGQSTQVTVSDETTYLQLAPGSTDLKTAVPSAFSSIALGDRILVTGKLGDAAGTLSAVRVILMKSSDIAARNAGQQDDWQKRGTGGIVRAVDAGSLTLASGPRTLTVTTTPTTIFRRYADDSVKFEDAKAGAMSQIQTGDQISVRGDKSADGASIKAEEVVTGTFENLSGVLTATDPAAGTLTLKDLATKKTVTVHVTPNSDLRKLPTEASAMFAARNSGGGPGGSAGPAGAPGAAPGRPRNAGMDLSHMLPRLPTDTVAGLHPGEAVMLVASHPRGADLTVITLLAGVEQILSATSSGSQPITLSPWNLGAPEGAGGGGGPQ